VSFSSNFFNTASLKQAEKTFRERLLTQPDNMEARLNLAWCLFIQAVHQSGQEMALLNPVPEYDRTAISSADSESKADSALSLLQDCLCQTYTIKHLSLSSEDHKAIERLQVLFALCGAQEQAVHAERRAIEKLIRLASAVSQSSERDCH
jgi:hypothetical protein